MCRVRHTGLDETEGRQAPLSSLRVVPGHQVIGSVTQLGKNASHFQLGDRVGVGWIFSSSGEADENFSPEFRATGRDLNSGYAECSGRAAALAISRSFGSLRVVSIDYAGFGSNPPEPQ